MDGPSRTRVPSFLWHLLLVGSSVPLAVGKVRNCLPQYPENPCWANSPLHTRFGRFDYAFEDCQLISRGETGNVLVFEACEDQTKCEILAGYKISMRFKTNNDDSPEKGPVLGSRSLGQLSRARSAGYVICVERSLPRTELTIGEWAGEDNED